MPQSFVDGTGQVRVIIQRNLATLEVTVCARKDSDLECELDACFLRHVGAVRICCHLPVDANPVKVTLDEGLDVERSGLRLFPFCNVLLQLLEAFVAPTDGVRLWWD